MWYTCYMPVSYTHLIIKGRRDLATANTHLELESLPTGGWGYDHFPLSARYVQGLGMEFLGMTGKFHQDVYKRQSPTMATRLPSA